MKGQWLAPVAFATLACAAGGALAQVQIKTDGRWRATLGAGASASSGNTEARSFNVKAEAVRATPADKATLHARALYGRTDGEVTADLYGFGGRYDFNLSPRTYAFGQADYLRDEPANLAARRSAAGGLGYKLIERERVRFDVFSGLGYTRDRFVAPAIVAGESRSRYGRYEVLFGEESNHAIGAGAEFKQKLVVFPNVDETGEYRATFDAQFAAAINRSLHLTAGLNVRYDSDPGVGLKKRDAVFLTGVTMKIE